MAFMGESPAAFERQKNESEKFDRGPTRAACQFPRFEAW